MVKNASVINFAGAFFVVFFNPKYTFNLLPQKLTKLIKKLNGHH